MIVEGGIYSKDKEIRVVVEIDDDIIQLNLWILMKHLLEKKLKEH